MAKGQPHALSSEIGRTDLARAHPSADDKAHDASATVAAAAMLRAAPGTALAPAFSWPERSLDPGAYATH